MTFPRQSSLKWATWPSLSANSSCETRLFSVWADMKSQPEVANSVKLSGLAVKFWSTSRICPFDALIIDQCQLKAFLSPMYNSTRSFDMNPQNSTCFDASLLRIVSCLEDGSYSMIKPSRYWDPWVSLTAWTCNLTLLTFWERKILVSLLWFLTVSGSTN